MKAPLGFIPAFQFGQDLAQASEGVGQIVVDTLLRKGHAGFSCLGSLFRLVLLCDAHALVVTPQRFFPILHLHMDGTKVVQRIAHDNVMLAHMLGVQRETLLVGHQRAVKLFLLDIVAVAQAS